jgi:photosystem II stability/assembly factor-like uncharacterized protein
MDKSRLIAGALIAVTCVVTGCRRPVSKPTASEQRKLARVAALKEQLEDEPSVAERLRTLQAWQQSQRTRVSSPFDQPQDALTYFLAKRLPEGQTSLGPSDYVGGLQQAAQMPVFSTVDNRFISANPPGLLSVASVSTTSLGGAWSAMGPGNIGGRTRSILIHPTTPTTMWAGGVAGGIWKTTDGGSTWTPKADLLINIAVNSMLLDPRNPNTLYAGTGEGFFNGDGVRGAGILKSIDGGETWTQLPSTTGSDFFYVQKIVMSRGSSQRLYAATRTGVFRSTDSGGSWAKVLDGATVNGCMDLAIQTDRPLAMVFASCGTFTQGAIYRALDTSSTQTWISVHSPAGMGRTSLALAPSNQSIIYAMSASNVAGNYQLGLLGVYRSVASGAPGTWTTQVANTSAVKQNTLLLSNPIYAALLECGFATTNQFLNQGWYDNVLAVDPTNPDVVWAGGIDLFRSDDAGQNWGLASFWWFDRGVDPQFAHADHHALVFHPQYNGTTNTMLFDGSDGGISVTDDARAPVSYSNPITGASPLCGNPAPEVVAWGQKNNGYQVTQFYDGAVYPDGDTFFGGTQDNGTVRGVTGSPNAWSAILGGDGGYVALNPSNINMLWSETTGLSMLRSTNGGLSFSAFTSGITESLGDFLFITPFAQDPSTPARMWIGGAYPWRTSKAADNPIAAPIWTQAGAFFGARVSAIGVSPLSSDQVYFGTQTGGVFTTANASTSTGATVWTSSKPRTGSNVISWIAPDPVAANIVYATVSTFNSASGTGHVFKSSDSGATWTNIDGAGATGMPDVPVDTIVVDPLDNQRLYVGTDIGVFVSIDGGANWARENTGFANVIVDALVIKNTAPRYIYAFTHGRSLFRAPL